MYSIYMKEIKHFFSIGMTWLHWYLLTVATVKISLAAIRTKKGNKNVHEEIFTQHAHSSRTCIQSIGIDMRFSCFPSPSDLKKDERIQQVHSGDSRSSVWGLMCAAVGFPTSGGGTHQSPPTTWSLASSINRLAAAISTATPRISRARVTAW